MSKVKSPQQAVKRLKIIGIAFGFMIFVIIFVKITSGPKTEQQIKSPLEQKMDRQIDSILKLYYPEEVGILSTGDIERIKEETIDDIKWKNTLYKYNNLKKNHELTEKEMNDLLADVKIAKEKLAETRPFSFQRTVMIKLGNGSERYLYQKMNEDSTSSEIIINAPRDTSKNKKPEIND